MRQRAECLVLPDVALEPGKRFFTDLCGFDVMAFFRQLSRRIDSKIVKMGLEYILSETFGTFDEVYPEDRGFLFGTLQKMEQRGPDYNIYDIENIDDEVLFLPASSYHFISHIFFGTILVDRVAVVLHLLDFTLLHEVKSLTHAFVNSVRHSVQQEIPAESAVVAGPAGQISEAQPQEPQSQATAQRSPGSKKDRDRIKATRSACEEIVKKLYDEKQSFESDKAHWKQILIFDNGKTNWKKFINTVEARLGSKPHYDTAREVWMNVPDKLKHNGRVREQ